MSAEIPNLENHRLSADQQIHLKSNLLEGLTIAYAITGSIAAVEAVKNIRELRRFGARVQVYASSSGLKFITPTALAWASGAPVITDLTDHAEHILAEDILLISPATANIISKSVLAIADEVVSTLVAGARGKQAYLNRRSKNQSSLSPKPPLILMVPTMHMYLWENPALGEHIKNLSKSGVVFHPPVRERGEEEKLKTPDPESIARWVAHNYFSRENTTNNILITAGAVGVPLDGVRMITNTARGETGLTLAKELYSRGQQVCLVYPEAQHLEVPPFLAPYTHYFQDYDSYADIVMGLLQPKNKKSPRSDFLNFSWAVFTAAVSDFNNDAKINNGNINKNGKDAIATKVSSDKPWKLTLTPVPKIIAEVRKKIPAATLKMVVFKYLVGAELSELNRVAEKMLQDYEVVISNRKEDINPPQKIRYIHQRDSMSRDSMNIRAKTKVKSANSPAKLNSDEELAVYLSEIIIKK